MGKMRKEGRKVVCSHGGAVHMCCAGTLTNEPPALAGASQCLMLLSPPQRGPFVLGRAKQDQNSANPRCSPSLKTIEYLLKYSNHGGGGVLLSFSLCDRLVIMTRAGLGWGADTASRSSVSVAHPLRHTAFDGMNPPPQTHETTTNTKTRNVLWGGGRSDKQTLDLIRLAPWGSGRQEE